jgi:hypothetical protein
LVERIAGRTPPLAFRGERPGEAGAADPTAPRMTS